MDENKLENFNDYNLIRDFLLHRLDPTSSMEVEERFFCEPQFDKFVLIVEEELMEDYAMGNLTSDERSRVRQYLLTTEQQREKLRSINQIRQTVNDFPDESSNKKTLLETLQAAFAFLLKPYVFGAVLLLIFSGILIFYLLNRNNPSSSLDAALLKKIEILNRGDAPENASLKVFEISRVSGRSLSVSPNNRFYIKPDDKIIEFQLAISDTQYKSYQATLNQFNSPPLVTIKDLALFQKNGLSFLKVKLPAEIFKKGYYEINITGVTDEKSVELGTFSFEILLTS
jgi:hypothetical protein